jgi:GAF domain-containing protein/HAMP domain-containing protein
MNMPSYFQNLLPRIGGRFILVVVAAAQVLTIPGALLSAVLIQLNAVFTVDQLTSMLLLATLASLAGSAVLIWISWFMFSTAIRKRLDAISQGSDRPKPEDELKAWKEISSFSWRYGVTAVVVGFVVVALPVALYFQSSGLTTRDQYVYTLFGGLVASLSVAVFGALLVEQLLSPARLLILPKDFSVQIAGRSGLDVERKIQVIVLTMVVIGILIIAPTGYHHIIRSMQSHEGSVVTDFQTQSVLLSMLVLGMGFGLAYFSTRPVSGFLRQMITTFTKVEEGDLSQRAPITATDETAELATHFNSMIARLDMLQTQLETEIKSRAEQLEATFEVGQAAHSIQNPDKMIEQVTNLIGDRFGYYFVAIYLVDPAERWAELKGATGAAGQVLLANKHRVDLTERNLIVLTMTAREAQVALHSGETQVHNPLLPYTRSEVALPLLVGDRTFGILDVHSTKEGVFGDQEIKMLQNMANQVAAALENTRLYDEAQQSLQEMRSSQRSYLKTSWDAISSERPSLGYTLGDEEISETPDILIPLILRDQKIGEISMSGETDWTSEERSIVEAVAAQAALALENARLVEDSQASAARDHVLADITAKIWSATTIDAILQTAIKELGRALESDDALIELKLED